MTTSRSTALAAIGLSLLLSGCAGGSAEWTAAPASAEVPGSPSASGGPGASGDPGASGGPASPGASASAAPSVPAPASSGSPAPSPGASAPASPPAAPDSSPAASQPPDSGSVEVTIGTDKGQELLFVPDTAEAPSGAAVTLIFQNVSQAPHNLTFNDPIEAATATIVDAGASATLEFTAPESGDYTFVCTLHPGMDGVLTVTE